ncbi:MAG: hypothetical protein GY810_30070 [Aureispira sp.]|nr:hypothetical protein [Aureispira sp.]
MAVSNELYELIQSLSKEEKHHFKLQASKFGRKDSVYIKIFDLMSRQRKYDEEKIKKKLQEHKSIKQFHVLKNYLYQQVLESLESYHEDEFILHQAIKQLHQSTLLFDRGLYEQAKELLEQAKTKALNYEKYELLPSILIAEHKLYTKELAKEKVALIPKKGHQSIKELRLFIDLNDLNKRMVYAARALYNEGEKDLSIIQTLIQEDCLKLDIAMQTTRNQMLYYSIYGSYYEAVGEYQLSLEYKNKLLDAIFSNEYILAEYPQNYLISINNLATTAKHDLDME